MMRGTVAEILLATLIVRGFHGVVLGSVGAR